MCQTEHPEQADPRMDPAMNPIAFDGKRLIYGVFAPMLDNNSDLERQSHQVSTT
jgi:hypothetical protein